MIMTKKVILSILGENYSQRKSMNINKLNKFCVPGIAIAEYVSKIHFVITDKAKPRAIVGRKATPACRNTSACRHGSLWDSRVAEASEENRIAVAECIGGPVSFFRELLDV